ncbi:MAG TPA: TIGR03618 family F420-dependent PPOX class oxidoreductase [Jatrophihabitans sp.]|nr:TIGR03618 family F420-dependent PPOX class oxidoreductase [Jatrophihabitans sp.]
MALDLDRVRELARKEDWLAILVTRRPDGQSSVSLVNVGIVEHPGTGRQVLGLVSRGNTAKLRNLRADPGATLIFRSGWDWVSVNGTAEIAGPDDPHPHVPAAELPALLRGIYAAAGGTHSDLAEYDREMVADRRAAVLVTPRRFTSNPTPHDRED